jgi:hypothetical protein
MGINPVFSVLLIALGAFTVYLVFAMGRILSTAPVLSPLAVVGGVIVVLLGIYSLVAAKGQRS